MDAQIRLTGRGCMNKSHVEVENPRFGGVLRHLVRSLLLATIVACAASCAGRRPGNVYAPTKDELYRLGYSLLSDDERAVMPYGRGTLFGVVDRSVDQKELYIGVSTKRYVEDTRRIWAGPSTKLLSEKVQGRPTTEGLASALRHWQEQGWGGSSRAIGSGYQLMWKLPPGSEDRARLYHDRVQWMVLAPDGTPLAGEEFDKYSRDYRISNVFSGKNGPLLIYSAYKDLPGEASLNEDELLVVQYEGSSSRLVAAKSCRTKIPSLPWPFASYYIWEYDSIGEVILLRQYDELPLKMKWAVFDPWNSKMIYSSSAEFHVVMFLDPQLIQTIKAN